MIFKIEKRANGSFWHYINDVRISNISDFDCVYDQTYQTFIIQCKNGSNVPQKAVKINDVILNVSGVNEYFGNVATLESRLRAINYTPYTSSGSGGIADVVFKQEPNGAIHRLDITDSTGGLNSTNLTTEASRATGDYSHADSIGRALGNYSHADSSGTASGNSSHADSSGTASGNSSHADSEGTASGNSSHADSSGTASGNSSHADSEGTASGYNSSASGKGTIANSYSEKTIGTYNENVVANNATAFNAEDLIFSIGIGSDDLNRLTSFFAFKNGGFKFISRLLTNITNATKGFFALDENARPNVHDGTQWQPIAYLSDISGSGIPDAPNDANAYVRSGLAWVVGYTKSAVDTLLATFKTDNFLDATSSIQNQINSKQTARVVETILTTGTTTLDFAYSSFNKITQTGNIVIDGTNLTGTKFIEKSILIQGSENATHTFTLPNNWKNISGVSPDSTKINYFEFNLINGSIVYSVNKYDIPDIIAPSLLKASLLLDSLNTIELFYSEAIDASVTTSASWFTVTGKTVTGVTILNNKVRVVVSVPFAETDTPTVTFTNQVVGAGIQDASGNKATNFSQVIGLLVYRFDNFNRADSTTSINNPSDAGSDWVTPFGAIWGIASNKAYCFSANTTTAQAHGIYLETNESNVILRKKVTYGTTGVSSASFLARYVDANNHYILTFGKLNTGQLYYSISKFVGGSGITVVANTNFGTWVSGTEYTFMVKLNGSSITLYNGTTSLVQITDNSLPTGTKHGLRIYAGSSSTGNTDRFDDFGVYYG